MRIPPWSYSWARPAPALELPARQQLAEDQARPVAQAGVRGEVVAGPVHLPPREPHVKIVPQNALHDCFVTFSPIVGTDGVRGYGFFAELVLSGLEEA